MTTAKINKKRCDWVDLNNPLSVAYHDKEWGIPVHDERKHFEMLVLEGAQAGLSWATILNRREAYRKAFDHFDPEKVARYDEAKIQSLLADSTIIRNGLKIRSAVKNARIFLEIQREYGSFDNYLWGFVEHKPIINHFQTIGEIPAQTELSSRISKALKKRGMSFVGPTIVYAHMQAIGMVNDHLTNCFKRLENG
ncbi:MAG: DNA-3-methyladenine glycosylase I [Bacillota bacterium]|nr:DNA-3-methyladenine glycosylase I [Bacillota bacterium]MDW7676113.1 DNA-3-methyladenine glycosylase I [Bacillota bacterium]